MIIMENDEIFDTLQYKLTILKGLAC